MSEEDLITQLLVLLIMLSIFAVCVFSLPAAIYGVVFLIWGKAAAQGLAFISIFFMPLWMPPLITFWDSKFKGE
jgi:hypothetical protein